MYNVGMGLTGKFLGEVLCNLSIEVVSSILILLQFSFNFKSLPTFHYKTHHCGGWGSVAHWLSTQATMLKDPKVQASQSLSAGGGEGKGSFASDEAVLQVSVFLLLHLPLPSRFLSLLNK